MSRFELIRAATGEPICAGDAITVNGPDGGIPATVTELEPPEPEFCGCVHYLTATGKEGNCSGESLGAEWHFDGQPFQHDAELDDREAFDSGRWTREDTESMERGRDLPLRNEAGEWLP